MRRLRNDPHRDLPEPTGGRLPRRPLLTAEQECALARRVAAGDRDARNELVEANLGLVFKIARGYAGRGLEPEDLAGEGHLGLITAAERFDPRFKVRFSTYASLWIKQAIREALGNTAATIRLPVHASALLRKWKRMEHRLEGRLGRVPHFEELAEALGLEQGQRRTIAQALRTRHVHDPGHYAVDQPVESPEFFLGPEEAEEREELRRRLGRLTPTERSVIELRYGLGGQGPLTLKEVSSRHGFTREWARKLEIRALAKLG